MARKVSGVQITGAKELHATCGLAAKEADKASSDAVFAIAKRVEHRLFRELQNKSRTGRLSFSLSVRRKKERDGILTAEVRGGGTAPYLIIREFGTSRTKAEPSITPAVEATRPEVPALYKEYFAEAVAKRLRRKK